MSGRALITGAAGQDGTYLGDLLLSKGYQVYGVPGPFPGDFDRRADESGGSLHRVDADMTDMTSILEAVALARPDEVYNLAALSSVAGSWEEALVTTDVNAVGVVRLLEAVREVAPDARVFQAASAEMFGQASECPQTESTPVAPRSPYAIAKTYAYHLVRSYRESYGLYACNGIMFNHESPLRSVQFVTRKITDGAARIKLGLADELVLGNLDARRDWGFAGDYVSAMWLMLQRDRSDDYVVASGETQSVRDFCAAAFAHLGLDYEEYVRTDARFLRPQDPSVLCGDPTRARSVLGWEPQVSFEELVAMMVDADVERLSRGDTRVDT